MDIEDGKWEDINNVILRKSPYQPDLLGYTAEEWKQNLFEGKVLVIGAGNINNNIILKINENL